MQIFCIQAKYSHASRHERQHINNLVQLANNLFSIDKRDAL